ncbi:aromatic ring-hydroxylating oxygenase subunit alpha [Massilia yuzhufengensis]|uniref:Phenylpropionate dioxygenase, large terminal subunit n=1 Tax=Massilia yuzhufengensis TaxID=1164594 RepID=A0A1I1G5K4_9BURK|nr:Rieske 2Fe-2S domain-containing protein [Massilia yuzhufengensis]SFC06845.1 Phenylpropionate dioxygenase, large terminal subunit [Massilia yuzhufengensis]
MPDSTTDFDAGLFRDHWHLACHRNELPTPGDYLRMRTPLGDLVVFNDSGELVAFDNLCPHRGARMFDGEAGNGPATCRYHGWSYQKGRVIVPLVEDFAGCDTSSARLNTYRLDWCGDFLFVGLAPRQGLYQQLGEAAALLENIGFNIAGRIDLNAGSFHCYWPVAVENALEPYHIAMVHPDTLGTLALQAGANHYLGSNSVWYAPLGNERVNKQLHGLRRHFAIDYGYDGYMSIYLFPFTMISSTFGYSYSLQHFFPAAGGAEETHFSSRLLGAHLANERSAQLLAPLFASTAGINRKVFEEDHEVCRRVPKSSWSPAPLAYPAASEAKIAHFRQSCRGWLES